MLSSFLLLLQGNRSHLEVGDGKPYTRIEAALAQVDEGGEIVVFPSARGYPKTALNIDKKVRLVARGKIELSGTGFDYSGVGKIPRAIIQVGPGGSGVQISGFKLSSAHNLTHNGAGIRIVEANDVIVKDCELADNDMGAMSNGRDGTVRSVANLRFELCSIHDNGNVREPGYNHNLYLSGNSVYIDRCLIYNPLTGHNLKSRAHLTWVTNCAIFGGNNRQIDCVDSWFSAMPNSDLMIYNSILAMNPNSTGNGNVIHFGQEGGHRQGTVYLYQSSVFTEFLTPILSLDSGQNRARVVNCEFLDPDPITPQFLSLPSAAPIDLASGEENLFSNGYQVTGLRMRAMSFSFASPEPRPPLIPGAQSTSYGLPAWKDYRPAPLPYGRSTLRSFDQPGAISGLFQSLSSTICAG